MRHELNAKKPAGSKLDESINEGQVYIREKRRSIDDTERQVSFFRNVLVSGPCRPRLSDARVPVRSHAEPFRA